MSLIPLCGSATAQYGQPRLARAGSQFQEKLTFGFRLVPGTRRTGARSAVATWPVQSSAERSLCLGTLSFGPGWSSGANAASAAAGAAIAIASMATLLATRRLLRTICLLLGSRPGPKL